MNRLDKHDIPVVAGLIFFGILLIVAHFRFSTVSIPYPSELFVPAAMFAEGKGFHDVDTATTPRLHDFISRKIWALNAGDLRDAAPLPLESDQRYQITQVVIAGLLFQLFGISWSTLNGLAAVYYCAAGTILYFLCRITMARRFAALGTILFFLQPSLLAETHFLRDFGKVPFIVLLVYLYFRLLATPSSSRRLFGHAVAIAAVTGLGLGFRRDLIIFNLPSALVLLLAPLAPGFRHAFARRLAAIAIEVLVFLAAGTPTLLGLERHGTLFWHDTLMGFSAPSDMALGTNNAAYTKLSWRQDNLVSNTAAATCGNRQVRTAPSGPAGVCSSDTSDPAKFRLLMRYIWLFPGDLVTRAYANALAVFRLLIPGVPAPLAILLAVIAPLAIFILSLDRMRLAWPLFLVGVFLCTYTSIQFDRRHSIQLLIIPCWSMAFVCSALCGLRRPASPWQWKPRLLASGRSILFFAAPATLLLLIPLIVARQVQVQRVTQFSNDLRALPTQTLPFTMRPAGAMNFYEIDAPLPGIAGRTIDDPFLVDECYIAVVCTVDYAPRVLWNVYDSDVPEELELTAPLLIDPSGRSLGETVTFYQPVYSITAGNRWSRFRGIALARQGAALHRIELVKSAEALPLHPCFAMRTEMKPLRLWQSISFDTVDEQPFKPIPSLLLKERRARELMGEGKYWEAEPLFHDALESNPRSYQVLHALAAALNAQGRAGEAIALMARGVSDLPEDCLRTRLLFEEFSGKHREEVRIALEALRAQLGANPCISEYLQRLNPGEHAAH